MAATFKEVRKLQGERVRMYFDDGREVVAVLLCATKDIDGSKHLIYDKVESGEGSAVVGDGSGCCYADAKSLLHIKHADTKETATGPRGRDRFSMRDEVEASLKSLRPSA
ncbi:MAG: hypothetical protein ABSG84_13910 [Acidobacteriaceae bacterium]|jgi:hypothetical protein